MNKSLPQQNKAFELRLACLEDCTAIRQVATETWHVTYAQTVRSTNREQVLANSYSDQSLKRSLSRINQDTWFWVAESCENVGERVLVGFAEAVLRVGSHPDAELTRIYVLPPWQAQGVGQALLENLLRSLRQLDPDLRPPRLWLAVEAHNARAIQFYERRGFQFFRNFYANLPGQLLEMQEYVLEI